MRSLTITYFSLNLVAKENEVMFKDRWLKVCSDSLFELMLGLKRKQFNHWNETFVWKLKCLKNHCVTGLN